MNIGKRLIILRGDHECCSSVHIKVLREARRWEHNNDKLWYKKNQKPAGIHFEISTGRLSTWMRAAGVCSEACLVGREPLWAEQFVEGQKIMAYELTDITGLIKTKGHWHTRASPPWRSMSSWLKELTVWVDSSLSMTWSLVEDARPIRKHACAH